MKFSSDVWKIEENDTIYKKDCEKEEKDQPPNTQTCYGTQITRNIKHNFFKQECNLSDYK